MPYIHTRQFRIRHYECDAYERLKPADYLRYMQESAFDASAAVGYNTTRYTTIGLQWLAYETDLTYIAPLHYNEEVTVKTWVHDFRRVRSLRCYELYRGDENGEHVATATTDWVLIDTQTLRPASIPPEMIDAYSQGEAVEQAAPRKPLPKSLPAKDVFSMSRTVAWSDIDAAQHVNNAVYLQYVQDCDAHFLQSRGVGYARLAQAGLSIINQRHQIEYKRSAVFGDDLTLITWLSDIGETTFVQHTLIKRANDDTIITRVSALRACIHHITQHPAPLPESLRQ